MEEIVVSFEVFEKFTFPFIRNKEKKRMLKPQNCSNFVICFHIFQTFLPASS